VEGGGQLGKPNREKKDWEIKEHRTPMAVQQGGSGVQINLVLMRGGKRITVERANLKAELRGVREVKQPNSGRWCTI